MVAGGTTAGKNKAPSASCDLCRRRCQWRDLHPLRRLGRVICACSVARGCLSARQQSQSIQLPTPPPPLRLAWLCWRLVACAFLCVCNATFFIFVSRFIPASPVVERAVVPAPHPSPSHASRHLPIAQAPHLSQASPSLPITQPCSTCRTVM